MWKWKERWINKHLVVYLSRSSHFGISFEISTSRLELFVGWFGISLERV